jgi:hypothetical protein
MSPWTVLGWILVAITGLIAVVFFAALASEGLKSARHALRFGRHGRR